jgi:mono/diheme cytochrome c family protein
MDPYPFSEKYFLVSHNPTSSPGEPAGYGIYVLDGWGNRAELYRDPAVSCFEPIPLRPRRRPTAIASVAATDKAVARAGAADEEKTASLFIQDVYQGMTGIERGRVKYVRVMGALPWPWSERGMNWVGMNVDVHRKRVYGIAKVHEDGSAYFSVPANENLFFQALDEDFMALQQMPTFINLMPGERRSCIGCHEPRGMAPSMAHGQPQALKHPPQTLVPQPGDTGPRMVHYNADVQPVLNKHCVGCHGGENPKGRLDLTGVPTEQYNRSYENFINKGLVSYADCRYGRSNFRAVPPLTRGSHLSKLTAQIRQDPCKANLTREEFVKIVTWIDANAPYYGTYRGKRDLKDKDQPDFRPPPLAGE